MRLLALYALGLVVAGCRVPPRGGLDEVSALLRARGVDGLEWRQRQAEEVERRRTIDELVAQPLSSDSAVKLALLSSPRLQATLERLGVAQADAVQAGLLRNPTFAIHPGIPFGAPTGEGVAWEGSLVLEVLDVFLLPLRKKLAKIQFEQVRLEVAAELWETVTAVRVAYFEAVAATQRLALQRPLVEAAEVSAEFAARQERAGTLNELGLVAEQGSYVEQRMDLVRAEREATAARERLVRLLGLWGERAQLRFPDRLPSPPEDAALDREDLEARAITARLDLQAREREAQALERATGIAKGTRFIGQLSVGADAHREPEGRKVAGPSLALELPIFDQGQAKIARLVAETRRARRLADQLAIEVRSEVREARSRMYAARSLARYLAATVIPLRERAVALGQRQYDAMLLGLPQLLLLKQAEVGAWRDSIDATRDAWVARAELERALGEPLSPKKEDRP